MARAKRHYLPGHVWHITHHATAVSSDRHLIQCIVYIDLNMVRTGIVNHPSEWIFGGYNEIQKPRERYALIDYKRLMELLHISTVDELRNSHKKWVKEILKTKNYVRESKWSQSIAVGSKSFVEGIKEKPGIRAKGRKVVESGCAYHLRETRETQAAYMSNFMPQNSVLRAKNTYVWEVNP